MPWEMIASRMCMNTVPLDSVVGGVPMKRLWGFGDADTTYFRLVS